MSILDRFGLMGKKVPVTGASRGIGEATNRSPAEAGRPVVLTARDHKLPDGNVGRLRTNGLSAESATLDVAWRGGIAAADGGHTIW